MSGQTVCVFEVGPRDGLQNEQSWVATEAKVRLVDLLSEAGLGKIEVTSFVSPKWVPQMKDAPQVMERIYRHLGTVYAVLTPNMIGYNAAKQARADEVAVFASASEGFSQKNINCSIEESFERFKPLLEAAKSDARPVRGYVSCVIDCPYDGPVNPDSVARVTEMLLEAGCYEVSLGDTIGAGLPDSVARMLHAVNQVADATRIAGHFHDTNGNALENIETALEFGVRTFDSSICGLGGCPYAPGAKGNVATEKVVERLEMLGYRTGIDRLSLDVARHYAETLRALNPTA